MSLLQFPQTNEKCTLKRVTLSIYIAADNIYCQLNSPDPLRRKLLVFRWESIHTLETSCLSANNLFLSTGVFLRLFLWSFVNVPVE